jgi:hypothetical protein
MLISVPLFAQTKTPATSPAGHGSAGGGVFFAATHDEAHRVRFPDASSDSAEGPRWLVYGSVFVARHISVGLEYAPLGTVHGRSDTLCCISTDAEEESVLYGTGRYSTHKPGRFNLDVVGGVGILVQHRETSFHFRFAPSSAATVTVDDRTDWCLVLGADAPISVAPHVVVSPIARVYFLSRKTIETLDVTASSATRFMLGLTAGVKW